MDCPISSFIHLFPLSLRNKTETNMNVNISALTEALDFINENSDSEICKDFIIHLYTRDKAVRGREMDLNITTRFRKTENCLEKGFYLKIERRYKENENINALKLYQHLTMPTDEWRREIKAKVTHSNKIAPRCEYSTVNVICQFVTIKEIKQVIFKIFKFIYSDDNFRELYVKMLDWNLQEEISFRPSLSYNADNDIFKLKELSMN